MNDPSFLIIILLVFGLMFLMSSRTRKQQRKAADFRAALAPGQHVMTASGLFGTVVGVDDDVILLEVSPGVTTRWLRPAIARLAEASAETGVPDPVDASAGAEPAGASPVSLRKDSEAPHLAVPDDASSLTDDQDPGSRR